jgi:hypothetical protein
MSDGSYMDANCPKCGKRIRSGTGIDTLCYNCTTDKQWKEWVSMNTKHSPVKEDLIENLTQSLKLYLGHYLGFKYCKEELEKKGYQVEIHDNKVRIIKEL